MFFPKDPYWQDKFYPALLIGLATGFCLLTFEMLLEFELLALAVTGCLLIIILMNLPWRERMGSFLGCLGFAVGLAGFLFLPFLLVPLAFAGSQWD